MSMPIQRQSEAFGIFDDGPRFARDRSAAELPRGLAGLLNSSGPRITAGLLNTRTAVNDMSDDELQQDEKDYGEWLDKYHPSPDHDDDYLYWAFDNGRRDPHDPKTMRWYQNHQDRDKWNPNKVYTGRDWDGPLPGKMAVNTDGMDPASHAYGRQPHDPLFGEFGHDGYDYEGVSRGEFNHRMRDYDPDEASARRREEIEDEDDASGYNWGPIPPEHLGARRGSGRHPFDRAAGRRQAAPVDWSQVRSGPLVDNQLREQDPDDYFAFRPYSGPVCPDCGRPTRLVSGPHCRHASRDLPPWEETDEGYRNPGTGAKIVPSEDTPGHWQTYAPAVVMPKKPKKGEPVSQEPPAPVWARIYNSHPDPQVLMQAHDYQMGGPRPPWHTKPRWWDSMAPPPLPPHTAAGPAAVPAQMQAPMSGGYQPAHRVGLPWRDQVIPGTVIGLDGPNVAVRWDDGQYSTEEPHNIQLL